MSRDPGGGEGQGSRKRKRARSSRPSPSQLSPDEAYEKAHRGLDAAFDALSDAVTARDALQTARATAAFKFHLDLHLDKEDTHLYRLIKERVSLPDQGKAVGVMADAVPPDRFPELVAWMFPLLGHDDRENMTRIWQMVMPPQAFAGATQLVQEAIGDDWAELSRRIPELATSAARPVLAH